MVNKLIGLLVAHIQGQRSEVVELSIHGSYLDGFEGEIGLFLDGSGQVDGT